MKRFREVVQSIYQPEDKNVLWLDISISSEPILKYYSVNDWFPVLGGGGSSPIPTRLKNYYYYGSSLNRVTVENINLDLLNTTNSSSATGYFDGVYFYIALTSDQTISSIITKNQEDITSQFKYIGIVLKNNTEYKLYEFFLDTLIPLDVSATIIINGNKK